MSDVRTNARISISHKDKQSGEYIADFSGYVNFFGSATARKATTLKERDRIKLGDVDVCSRYNKEKNITYYYFNVYSFETQDDTRSSSYNTAQPNSPQLVVDNGEVDELPF